MKILFPHTDSFGGFGGIAKYNRDFLTALCAMPECEEVVALPRLAPDPIGKLPERLTCLLDGLGGKLKWLSLQDNGAHHGLRGLVGRVYEAYGAVGCKHYHEMSGA